MKKIIILSDTHRNQKILRSVFKIEKGYTHIFHLGDDYEDLDNNFDITDNIDDKYFINPGHLTARRDRDRKASYIVMIINKDNAEIQFKYLDGEVFKNKIINKL